jgi:hypothetical protein
MTQDELHVMVLRVMEQLQMVTPMFTVDAISVWTDGHHWVDLTDRRGTGNSRFRRITLPTLSVHAFEDRLRTELTKVRDTPPSK